MGFLKPNLPDFDYDEWRAKPRAGRVRAMVVHWGSAGFGAPDAVYLLYVLKIIGYVAAAMLFVTITPGIGRTGGPPRPDARATLRARRPAIPGRPDSVPRQHAPGMGVRARSREL